MRCLSAFSWHWFLTLSENCGNFGPVKPPVNVWLWALKLKNCLVDPFKVSSIKAKYTKNIFGKNFPTEHNAMTDYSSYWNIKYLL